MFAPLVVALIGASTPATILASKIYPGARPAHYVVHAAGIPVVRTLAFAPREGCQQSRHQITAHEVSFRAIRPPSFHHGYPSAVRRFQT